MADRIHTLGWTEDPTGAHHLRYHDGVAYTQFIFANGVVGVDALPVGPTPTAPAPIVGEVLPPVLVQPDVSVAVRRPSSSPFPPSAPGWVPPPSSNGPPPWEVGVPVAPEPAAKRRRVGLWIAVGAAAVEALAIVVLSVALVGPHAPHAKHPSAAKPIGTIVAPSGSFGEYAGLVVYSSNFAASDAWDTGSLNANTTATVFNGQYIVNGWTSIHHALFTPYATPQRGISVEASATSYPVGNVSMGTGCQSASGVSPALVYQMVVYPDGQWYIEEARIPGSVQTLLAGRTAALGSAASMQLTCVITTTNADAQTTQLVGYVNGAQVGAVGDQINRVDVGGYVPILVLGSFGPKVSAAFNHVTVRSVSPPVQPELQLALRPDPGAKP